MKANYHTHTARCGHAFGTDDEYVLAAIAQGFDVLGMSDHVPWPYASGFVHPHVRMPVAQLEEYVASMRALRKTYADRIRLLIGFECEYFPDYMNWLAEMRERMQLDYLIFGNHYDTTDEGGFYFGNARTAADLRRYVLSAEKGAATGLFAYMAHPDVFMRRYGKFDENCRAAARDLCAICRQNNLPMEYNLHDRYRLGPMNRDGYPHPAFFEIALSEGIEVIAGLDAHEPQEIADPTQWKIAMEELKVFGDRKLETIRL